MIRVMTLVLAAVLTAGAGIPVAVTAVMGEVLFTIRLQLRLVYDIHLLYGIPLDAGDPEDLMGIFAIVYGVKLAEIGGRLLITTLEHLEKGSLAPTAQDHGCATMAPLLKKEDGLLDWTQSASDLANRVRGLTPWPGAYTFAGEERWAIWRAAAMEQDAGGAALVAARVGEHGLEERRLHFAQHELVEGVGLVAVEVAEIALQALAGQVAQGLSLGVNGSKTDALPRNGELLGIG